MSTLYCCASCNKDKGPKAYSKSQLKNKKQKRCKRCIEKSIENTQKVNDSKAKNDENDRLQMNMAKLSLDEKSNQSQAKSIYHLHYIILLDTFQ